jgi:hypothetical protein
MNILLATMTVCLLPASAGATGANSGTDHERIRRGLQRTAPLAAAVQADALPAMRLDQAQDPRRDSVVNGALIGAAIGAGGGYVWARDLCGKDMECFAIAGPVGMLGGAGIGAAVGAVLDYFNR